jgi:hypothetical protein
VNGQTFEGVMPAWRLSDDAIASVLTFVTNNWGNTPRDFTDSDVASNRVGEGAPDMTSTAKPHKPWLYH